LTKWEEDFEDDEDDFGFGAYFRNTWIDSDHWRWFEGKL
jgi:hypothetical protein